MTTFYFSGLKEFFCQIEHGKGHIEEILENLEKIKTWALEQRTFRLYSSSVLIIYEGDKTLNTSPLVKESDFNVSDNTSNDNEMLNIDSTVKEQTENALQASNNISEDTDLQAELCTETVTLQNEHSNCVDTANSLVKCRKMHDSCLQKNIRPQKPKVSIHLVDFAHTYIGHYKASDENYLYGLDNLIHYLEQLVR